MADDALPKRPMSVRVMREAAKARGAGHCEFCRMVEVFQHGGHEIDHVVPESRGGPDHLDNFALLCRTCNSLKSSRLTCFDPETETEVEMYHPRLMVWAEHFVWDGFRIDALSAVGRGLIYTLQLNTEARLFLRQVEWREKCFPPPLPTV